MNGSGSATVVYILLLFSGTTRPALGNSVLARVAQRTERPGGAFAIVASAAGITVLLSSAALGKLPILYISHCGKANPDWLGEAVFSANLAPQSGRYEIERRLRTWMR
jgi:hypothetical protein